MSSTPSTTNEGRSKNEPDLTPSTMAKINMLPGLKRRQLIAEHQNRKTSSGDEEHSTASQRLDRSSEMSRPTFDSTRRNQPPNTKAKYIISNHSVPLSGLQSHGTVAESPEAAVSNPDSINEPLSNIQLADMTTKTDTAARNSPLDTDEDVTSRLESLRNFKRWSARIREDAQQREQCTSTRKLENSAVLSRDTSTKDPCSQEKIKRKVPLSYEFEALGPGINAPTPFSSPHIIPVPHAESDWDQSQSSTPPPALDIRDLPTQEAADRGRSDAHSRTMIVPPCTLALQNASRSRSAQSTEPDVQAPICNSTSRKRPPVSFPKDFYERFPLAEETFVATDLGFSTGRQLTPGISPTASPAPHRQSQAASEEVAPSATPCNKRGRPTFYTTVHYFTDCPHASPPANRPIDRDAQPRPDPDFHPFDPSISRSIIPGSCFPCDIAQRRTTENNIINVGIGHIALLTTELGSLLDELELTDSNDEEADFHHDKHSARLLTSSTFAEDTKDIDLEVGKAKNLPPLSDDPEVAVVTKAHELQRVCQDSFLHRITRQIRELEAQIDDLRDEQDKQVKKVWQGFTPRWGPATLGIQKNYPAAGTRQNPSASDTLITCESSKRHSGEVDVGHMADLDAMHLAVTFSHRVHDGSDTNSHNTSRLETGSSCSRSETSGTSHSKTSVRDVPGSRSPGEGKMRVGWVRENKK